MTDQASTPIEQTPIWLDIKSTILSGPKKVGLNVAMMVHTGAGDFTAMKILEIQDSNDYTSDVYGNAHIRVNFSVADYVFKLYPYRDMLEITLKFTEQDSFGGMDIQADVQTLRYRAILDGKKNPRITGDRIAGLGFDTLSTMAPVEATLELLDRNQEVLRIATVSGGICPDATPAQIISGLMVGESNKYTIDGLAAIQSFSMVPPDNSDSIPDCYIPPGLKVGLIPTYIQEKSLGVYSSGLGTHYQLYKDKPSWFVYPLFRTDRFDEDVERLVIFSIPKDKYSGLDQTYRKEGKILYIVVTGDREYIDDSQLGDLNVGVGVRIPNATGIFNGGSELTPRGPQADRARLNTEVASRTRTDGVYYAPTTAPTDNPFKHYSTIASQQVSRLNIVWENSKPEYIYPGMPCKFVFMNKGEYTELKGVVLGRYTVTSLMGPSATTNTYRRSTHLGICQEYHEEKDLQFPEAKSPGYF